MTRKSLNILISPSLWDVIKYPTNSEGFELFDMVLILVWWYTSIDEQINITNIRDQSIWIYVNIFHLGLLESSASGSTAPCLQPQCEASRRFAWFMSRLATAETSTGALSSCISSESLHFVLGTDCLFVTWNIVSVGEARGKVTPSQPFLRVVFSSFFSLTSILSDRQSLSGRCHPAAKRWRGSKTLERRRRISVQSKKKRKKCKRNGKSIALNKSPLVWRIKTYLWKERVCLLSLDSGCLYSHGAASPPIRPRPLPLSVVWSSPRQPPTQPFSYSWLSLILHFIPWPRAVSALNEELRRAAQPVTQ